MTPTFPTLKFALSSWPTYPTVYSVTSLEFPACISIQHVHCTYSADALVSQSPPSPTYKAELSTIEANSAESHLPASFATEHKYVT